MPTVPGVVGGVDDGRSIRVTAVMGAAAALAQAGEETVRPLRAGVAWLVQAACVVGQAHGFALVGTNENGADVTDGSGIAGVVAVVAWISVIVAVVLLCWRLTRRARSSHRNGQLPGTAVRACCGVAVATVAAFGAVVALVWAVDELTDVIWHHQRRGHFEDLGTALRNQGPAAVTTGDGGGVVATATAWAAGAAGSLYLAELIVRQVVIVVAVASIPLVTTDACVWSRSPRRMAGLRWALAVIVIKPALTGALVIGVTVGSQGGVLGLVAITAVLVFLVSGPVTLFQLLACLGPTTRAGQRVARWRSPRTRRSVAGDHNGRPDARSGPATPGASTRSAVRSAAPPGPRRLAVAARAAMHALRFPTARGRALSSQASGDNAAVDVAWPVVREIPAPRTAVVTANRQDSARHRYTSHLPRRYDSPTRHTTSGQPPTRQAHPAPSAVPAVQVDNEPLAPTGQDVGGQVNERADGGPSDPMSPTEALNGQVPFGAATAASHVVNPDTASADAAATAATPRDARLPAVTIRARATDADPAGTPAAGADDGVGQPRRTRWALAILGCPTVLAFPDTATQVNTRTFDGGGLAAAGYGLDAVAVAVTAQLSPRMLEVLVFLAVHPEGVRRDAVVAALWPDTGRHRPANNLSALLTRLRAALAHPAPLEAHGAPDSAGTAAPNSRADVVTLDGDRYRLDPDQITVDYWTFLAMTGPRPAQVRPSTTGDRGSEAAVTVDGETLAALHTAHELYRGPLADGLDAEWVLSVREAARRSYLDATARLVRHHAATSPAVALQLLETARNLDPTNENLYRDIIALQLRAGDRYAADNTLRLLETQLADIDEVVSEPVTELARTVDPDRE